jgi:S1-C subfamily serine protease
VNLEPGDIIYTVNRQEIQNLDGLRSTVASTPGGTPLVLQIERNRKLLYVTLETD